MYGEGISHNGELIDLGVKYDLVQKSGSWYSIGDERIGQGRDNAKNYLRDNPDAAEALEAAIRPGGPEGADRKAPEAHGRRCGSGHGGNQGRGCICRGF